MRKMNEKMMTLETKAAVVCGKALGWVQNRVHNFGTLAKEERGASDLVTTLILVVIVIAVAAIFKNQLVRIVNAVGNKVMTWINGSC